MYHFLYNCVFGLAFINFLIYWINLFFSENQTNNKINNNSYSIPASTLLLIKAKLWTNSGLKHFRTEFITCSLLWFALTLLIFLRITQSNHFPLANFYEALIFLTWCLVTLNFIILLEPTGKKKPVREVPVSSASSPKNISTMLSFSQMTVFSEEQSVQKQVSGAVLAPIILFIIAFAQFHLSSDVTPLVPALKSNWLLMHVSIMICSYTTFIIGGLLSIILLMQTLFSSSITYRPLSWFFKKPSDQPWNNKDKMLFMNYPWFQKNTIKAEWPSFWSIAISQKNRDAAESIVSSQANSWGETQLSYVNHQMTDRDNFLKMQNQMHLNPDFSKPLENLKSNETTNLLWQQNLESNWGFPSFEHVSEGSSKMQKKNFYIILDNLSYRMMGIGFPLFTLGILSGAVWANEAWGSYWSWDIKEVGSFINWLLVALYFHCRYKNFISLSHVIAFISLMVLFFNFFGISLGIFGSSLHAYGASS